MPIILYSACLLRKKFSMQSQHFYEDHTLAHNLWHVSAHTILPCVLNLHGIYQGRVLLGLLQLDLKLISQKSAMDLDIWFHSLISNINYLKPILSAH